MDKKCGRGRKCIRQSLIQTMKEGFFKKTLLHLLKCELKLTFLSAPSLAKFLAKTKNF
jgi:hypothetical protein